jgi:peptidoglycan-N-acetylglucosamine deacetylase
LKAVAGGRPLRYFRSPYLHTAPTLEKKVALEKFLKQHGYQQAPVTIDNGDWMFSNALANAIQAGDAELQQRIRREYVAYMERVTEFYERRSVALVGREFPQILLIHANVLNAQCGGELLQMFRRRGYRFVSLESALRDEAYRQPDGYIGNNGFSLLHRWTVARGEAIQWEPDEPQWIREAAAR